MARQTDGSIILGGDFWSVNGLPRCHLVRVNRFGQLDESWLPNPDRPVFALAMSGSALFAGGYFKNIACQPRARLAKLSTLDGPLLDPVWNPGANSGVLALATNGAELLVGGEFTQLGGLARRALGKVGVFGAGDVDPAWNPSPDGPSGFSGGAKPRVYAIALDFPSAYIAGNFTQIGGRDRSGLARLRADGTGIADQNWSCDLTFTIFPGVEILAAGYCLALDGPDLFVGGFFSEAAGEFRFNIAKVAAATGVPDSEWNPGADNGVGSLAVRGGTVLLGASQALNYLAAFADDGDFTQGSLFFPTNGFTQVDFEERRNFAEVSRTTGIATPLDPSPDGAVHAILPRGEDIFVGGSFLEIGREARSGIAFLPVANPPVIAQDPANVAGLIVGRSMTDGGEVTHFKLQAATGGAVFKHDGLTPVLPGDFITVAEGQAGLVFRTTGIGTPAVTFASSLNATANGVGAGATTASVVLDRTLPVVRLSQSTYEARESDTVVVVFLEKPAGIAATVTLTTSEASARDGLDFTGTTGTTITLPANETVHPVPILLARDNTPEPDENFSVTLTADALNATVAAPATAIVTIHDSDRVGAVGSVTEIVLPVPAAPPTSASRLLVELQPPAAHGQWRLGGEVAWRDAGSEVSGLAARSYGIEFRPVQGYRAPGALTINIPADAPRTVSAIYTPLPLGESGALRVVIKPDDAAADSDPLFRGRWRRVGEIPWRDSGTVLMDLPVGVYPVEFQPLAGFVTPAVRDAIVESAQTNGITGLYTVADTSGGATPEVVNFSDLAGAPFCFNGQLQSALGLGSGVAVQRHVVLTVAHLLFDDEALTYVTAVRWFHQRYRDRFEPVPDVARGWLVFNGYAAQRALAPTPGQGTLASHNLDVAAVYFSNFAARGGFGGYLV